MAETGVGCSEFLLSPEIADTVSDLIGVKVAADEGVFDDVGLPVEVDRFRFVAAVEEAYRPCVVGERLRPNLEVVFNQCWKALYAERVLVDVAVPSNSAEISGLLVKRIRQIGVNKILYGSDAATGSNLRPKESWAAFCRLALTEKEIITIAKNAAPFLR